jgi:hypothetical protein
MVRCHRGGSHRRLSSLYYYVKFENINLEELMHYD